MAKLYGTHSHDTLKASSSNNSLSGDKGKDKLYSGTSYNIFVTDLNGHNGFVISGRNEFDYLGSSVSGAGDINGDGLDDLIIGAEGVRGKSGSSYVVFGSSEGFGERLNPKNLDGSNGFAIDGMTYRFGNSVSEAGDVNGDGFSDVIVGVIAMYAVESYVVFGSSDGFSSHLNQKKLNGRNGFALNGISAYGLSVDSVSSAGDINGDGFDDLMIGVDDHPSSSYIVFGDQNFAKRFDLSQLDGSNGFVIHGVDKNDQLGRSVSDAGDVNGDGFDDILIAAPYGNPGRSYVIFGTSEFAKQLHLNDLDGSNGFVINRIESWYFSNQFVSSAGDFNGDGFDDLLLGSFGVKNQPNTGESYVVFGKAGGFAKVFDPKDLDGSNGLVIKGFNSSVSSAGDVNGDGFDDLLIADTKAAQCYVVFGKAVSGSSLSLDNLDASDGFVINSFPSNATFGHSVSSAGDINGDGFDDIVIGADTAVNGKYAAGESYVIFGSDFTKQVTRAGTGGDDTLIGTASNNILIGGLGNDIVFGGCGQDVLKGGSGNDILSFDAADRCLEGGNGKDTLRIDDSGVNLDLTATPNNKLTGFEIIDLTGMGNNSLKFNKLDVLHLSDTTNQLIIKGDSGDAIASYEQGWNSCGTATLDGLYNRYIFGSTTLLVDADITSTIS